MTDKKEFVNFIKEKAKTNNSLNRVIDGNVKSFPTLSADEEDNVVIGATCTWFTSIKD